MIFFGSYEGKTRLTRDFFIGWLRILGFPSVALVDYLRESRNLVVCALSAWGGKFLLLFSFLRLPS
jgi:hypothetical protein